ncbi:hypothetical protein [Collinsella ihumii]|uniref:hypothetical protein n=1 Tax=Collinsella ihumii TaxID=1720204 RepID=UPI0011C8154A|nr:hypothetical protein [Collinsella ihumii]
MIDRRRALKILVLSALGLVPVPSTAMALIVPRSWYGWSFTLTGKSITTPAQYFDGNNIGIEMTCSAAVSGRLLVSCHSGYSGGSSLGTRSFSYQGFTKATWQSNDPGIYRFVISRQGTDSAVVRSSDVKMYSW